MLFRIYEREQLAAAAAETEAKDGKKDRDASSMIHDPTGGDRYLAVYTGDTDAGADDGVVLYGGIYGETVLWAGTTGEDGTRQQGVVWPCTKK